MIHVSPAPSDRLSTALALMFSRHQDGTQFSQVHDVLDASLRGEICLDGLLLAEEGSTPVGAGLFVMQPDKTAFVWPPVVADRQNSAQIADAIFAELCRQVDRRGAWLSQCLVEIGDTSDRDALTRNGFGHLADLCYLQRLLNEPLPSATDAELASVVFSPENRELFAAIIERTYVDSLDCPGLKGTRSGLEALEGHAATGEFDPSRWKIYFHDGCAVGILLMNDHSDQNAWEVVYTGVVPEARGKGFGRAILRNGICLASTSGRRALLLAVDERNIYARNVYASLGFREIARRAAHVRISPHRVG